MSMTDTAAALIAVEEEHAAHNYHPLPVVAATGEGSWITDVEGRRYLDCLAAYSAVNFGHSHPVLLEAAREQLGRVTLTSRAFHNDRLGPFVTALAALAGKDMVLPMNTGAEAVESGIKVARAWGYRVKGVAPGRANIVVAAGNFHGRTTTIISFSDDAEARDGFAPFTPGFRTVPFGNASALEAAIDEDTVAVLLEPIQGEAGIVVPPAGYLPAVREITARRNVLFIADEIQSGLGRTGATFACDLDRVVRTSTCSARLSAGASSRCPPWSRTPTYSASCSQASTARPSAATRSPPPSASRSSRCSRPATTRPLPASAAPSSMRASRRSSAGEWSPSGAPDSGPASTSTRSSPRAVPSVRH